MWKDVYSIGDDTIDEQHRGLFAYVENLIRTLMEDDLAEEAYQAHISMSLAYMKNYAVKHFADEEAYAIEIGFADAAAHKEMHEAFKLDVAAYEAELVESEFDKRAVKKFLTFVLEWLIHHVGYEDRKLAKSANDN